MKKVRLTCNEIIIGGAYRTESAPPSRAAAAAAVVAAVDDDEDGMQEELPPLVEIRHSLNFDHYLATNNKPIVD